MSHLLRPVLLCLCVAIVASVTVDARPARKLAKFKIDISVSEVKALVKEDVARWDEFKGTNFYEGGTEVPAQNIILDGGKNVTERYLVSIDNRGTKSDSVSLKIDIPDEVTTVEDRAAANVFEVTIYAATLKGRKLFRGDDVTVDFFGNDDDGNDDDGNDDDGNDDDGNDDDGNDDDGYDDDGNDDDGNDDDGNNDDGNNDDGNNDDGNNDDGNNDDGNDDDGRRYDGKRYDGNGVVLDMGPGDRLFYWIEIAGFKGFKKDDYVAVEMRARSLKGSTRAIPVSSNPNDTVGATVEDYFFVTFGSAGVILIPGGGGGGGGGSGVDAIDHKIVKWNGPMNVGPWAITSTLTSVSQTRYQWCMDHTKKFSWPVGFEPGGGVNVNGNMWAIANIGGTWYAGIIEWLTPGMVCQSLGSGGAVNVLQAMSTHWFFSPLRGYVPKPGETIYVFVSAVAWPGHVPPIVNERTQIVKVTVQ